MVQKTRWFGKDPKIKGFLIIEQALWKQYSKRWNVPIGGHEIFAPLNWFKFSRSSLRNTVFQGVSKWTLSWWNKKNTILTLKTMDDYNVNQTTQTPLGSGMTSWKHLFISQPPPDKFLQKNRTKNKLWGQFPIAPKNAILVVLKSITELWEHPNTMQQH